MDTTDRPELRLWKILWPSSIIAGMSMIVRMMHHQYVQEQLASPEYEGWADPSVGLGVSVVVLVLTSVFLLARVRPDRIRTITISVTVILVAGLWALSFVPDLEVYVPVIAVLAVPIVRGLRLPVLVPRGKKLLTWIATLLSFLVIPLIVGVFAVGDLQLLESRAGNIAFVIAASGLLAAIYAGLLIGKEWAKRSWRGVLLEFVAIQVMVGLGVKTVLERYLA